MTSETDEFRFWPWPDGSSYFKVNWLLLWNYRVEEIKMYPFMCPCNRVENESRQRKAATQREEEEDPYGGSTDENTDAEAEQDHLIPDLPGIPVIAAFSSCLVQIHLQEELPFLNSHTLQRLRVMNKYLFSMLHFIQKPSSLCILFCCLSSIPVFLQTSWAAGTFSFMVNFRTTRGVCCWDTSLLLMGMHIYHTVNHFCLEWKWIPCK